jgi:hypothetical protein
MIPSRLVRAAFDGLIQQIPVLGPIYQSITDEVARMDFEREVLAVLYEISRGSNDPKSEAAEHITGSMISRSILQADAQISDRLRIDQKATSGKKFLYLAGEAYASEVRTFEICIKYDFLWRSYHRRNGPKIGKVDEIAVNDLILLGYRCPGGFRVSLPLIVKDKGPHTRPIASSDGCIRHENHSPFAIADDELTKVLAGEGYTVDQILGKYCGLNVDPLNARLEEPEAMSVSGRVFPAPKGNDSIWRIKDLTLEEHKDLRLWIDTL